MRNVTAGQHFLGQIETIFKKPKGDVEREFSPYFYMYYKRLFEHSEMFKAYSKMCKHIFDVTNAKGKNIIDIGCGFGLISIHLAIYGTKVISVDLNEERIKVFEKILRSFVPPLDNVKVRLGDALELDYKDEYFDIAICNEVVSHVRNLDLLLLKINRALKRSGVLYISDGNNKLNILQRPRRRKVWEKAECGYKSLRKKKIKELLPAVNAETLNLLAQETAGMYGNEISKAVHQYIKEGKITNKASFKFREPTTGYYPEREFNPFVLKNTLQEFGFKAKILRPYFVAEHRSSIKRIAKKCLAQTVRLFHPLSLLVSTKFEILAEKL